MNDRLRAYLRLMRADKPIGILLLLWPTLWGVWIAWEGHPPAYIVLIFVVGTALMRSAGCVMNDMADVRFDAHVKRTAGRPLVTGAVGRREALMLAFALTFIAFMLVLFLNERAILYSVIALALAASYPFTKRFFAIPQAYLGIAFGFGIPMAFAARGPDLVRFEAKARVFMEGAPAASTSVATFAHGANNLDQGLVAFMAIPEVAWWMLLANIFWAIAYDTEYAMVDRDDDIKIGMRTSAITFGRLDVAAVMVCYLVTLGLLSFVGARIGMGAFYYAGLAAAALIMGYHYTLIRERSREGCFKAFLHNNWVGAAVFAGIALDYLWRG